MQICRMIKNKVIIIKIIFKIGYKYFKFLKIVIKNVIQNYPSKQTLNPSHYFTYLMMPFSTGTGLGRVEVVGLELGLLLGRSASSESGTPLPKQK